MLTTIHRFSFYAILGDTKPQGGTPQDEGKHRIVACATQLGLGNNGLQNGVFVDV